MIIVVSVCSNINQALSNGKFEIYPKPTRNKCQLSITNYKGELKYSLLDIQGKVIIRKNLNVKTEQIEDPKKGTYEIYKYLNNLGSTNEEVDSNLEEFFWNDMFAAINIIQLTVTDLAYYKNLEDFQKRYAQVHSPTMKMNTTAIDENGERYSKDGLERTIYLKDFEIVSEITPQIKTVLYNKVALG